MAFQPVQLEQASFLQKNQSLQNVFYDICNAEMAQSLSSLQKSEFLKLIISFFHYFWCHIFSIFGSKINKFWRKKWEKNEKIPKT